MACRRSIRKIPTPQPVLLWLIAAKRPGGRLVADPDEQLPHGRQRQPEATKEAHKAEQVETPENKNPMLAMFRAESLPTWAEYVRVNRAYDEDEDRTPRMPPRTSTSCR
jgi:nitric oxide reductase NorD protein